MFVWTGSLDKDLIVEVVEVVAHKSVDISHNDKDIQALLKSLSRQVIVDSFSSVL